MRKAFLIFFLIMLPSLSQAQSVSYTCPMHPEIHSAKPGKCPKCGMNLVKEKTKAKSKTVKAVKPKSNPTISENKETADVVKYTCPMHP